MAVSSRLYKLKRVVLIMLQNKEGEIIMNNEKKIIFEEKKQNENVLDGTCEFDDYCEYEEYYLDILSDIVKGKEEIELAIPELEEHWDDYCENMLEELKRINKNLSTAIPILEDEWNYNVFDMNLVKLSKALSYIKFITCEESLYCVQILSSLIDQIVDRCSHYTGLSTFSYFDNIFERVREGLFNYAKRGVDSINDFNDLLKKASLLENAESAYKYILSVSDKLNIYEDIEN